MKFFVQPPRWFWRVGACLASFMFVVGILGIVDGRPAGYLNVVMGVLLYAAAWYAVRNGRPFGSPREAPTASS
jgi:uncharacterized membrane protein YfcA